MNILKYLPVLSLFLVFTMHALSQNQIPIAKKGIIDLRDWNFNEKGIIELDGEWEFYWNEFLEPGNSNDSVSIMTGRYINVPNSWKDHEYNGEKLSNLGFASYRLKILIKNHNQKLKLQYFLPTMSSRCYVNGRDVLSSGKLGKTKEEANASFVYESQEFSSDSDTLEVLIHVSNFMNPKGGLFSGLQLGTSAQIDKKIIQQSMINSFLLGIFLLMLIYHVVLYLLRRKDISNLYFALSCLGFFVYNGIVDGLFSAFIPNVEFIVLYRLMFLSLTVIVSALFLFVYSLYPEDYNKRAIISITIVGILFIFTTILPEKILISEFVSGGTQVYLIVAAIYTIFVIIKAFFKKRQDAGVLLLGLLILILSMVNDTLHNLNIIHTIVLVNFGLLTFFLFQSYIISARFSRAFGVSEKLTNELQNMNENLENMIIDRTREIETQKEEILAQTEQLKSQNDKLIEMDRFKQGMTSMIVHDLKNPLNTILSVSDSIGTKALTTESETLKGTGLQMLNMVLNILDVNKFEEASMAINFGMHALLDIVKLATKQVEFLVKQKNIQIINNFTSQYKVLCDRDIIERVLVNLFTNAIKYSPHNSSIEILVYPCTGESLPPELKKIDCSENTSEKLLIAVKDNGTGIKQDAIPLIFQKFRQLDAVESGNVKSTGLGLTFCKLAIEAHGGEIGVNAEQEKGSLFWFTLKTNKISKSSDLIEQEKPEKNVLITLSATDKEYLNNYLNELTQLEYYEVTSIRRVLATINADISDPVKAWKDLVELAIKNSNQEEYEKLIKSL